MRTFRQVLLLGLIGAALGVSASSALPNGIAPWAIVRPTAASDQASCVAPSTTPTITIAEALELFRSGHASFLDLRSAEAFASGHVAGAVHMPCRSTARPEADLPVERTVVLYGDAHDAEWAAEALRARGIVDVRVLQGDYAQWRAAQGAAESGACPGCDVAP